MRSRIITSLLSSPASTSSHILLLYLFKIHGLFFLAVFMCTYWFLNITYLVCIRIAIFVSLELTIWYWISSWCILPWRRHSHSEDFSILGESLFRVEVSWDFHHPLWHIYWCCHCVSVAEHTLLSIDLHMRAHVFSQVPFSWCVHPCHDNTGGERKLTLEQNVLRTKSL